MPDRNGERIHRRNIVLRRWGSIVSCGIVAGTLVHTVEPYIRTLATPLVDRWSVFPPVLLAAIYALIFSTGCWIAGHHRWRGFAGWSFLHTYPPLWMAVLIGVTTWLSVRMSADGVADVKILVIDVFEFGIQVWWLVLLPPILGAGIARAKVRTRRGSRQEEASADSAHENTGSKFQALRTWLLNDTEISLPVQDRFGHKEIADRIAGRLVDKNGAPTMALIGSLGSGKSSIRRLVGHRLKESPTVRLIDVSLWPFDSAEAAVRGILSALVRELGQHVNVLPLAGLSEDYVASIENAAGSYGGLARLLRRRSDPEEIIRRFSEITIAIGLRFVLWVEDLERFSGEDQLEGDARIEREVERLGPIRALLHLLDRCPQLSVVVSDTSLRTRFDIGKIARFVEHPPTMNVQRAWDDVNLARKHCLGGHPCAVIDPTDARVREEFERHWENQVSAWLSSFRESRPSVPMAIARVLNTPRSLKWALRVTLETWEAMPGEVDFDSVFAASVVKVSRPDLFALISEHIDLFRHGFRDPIRSRGGQEEVHPVLNQIHELLSREDERTGGALTSLLTFLFPAYGRERGNLDAERDARPQALFADSHTDYWRRYLAQISVPADQSDQVALQSIAAWQGGDPSDLIERVMDPNRSAQIVSFVKQFAPREVCRLLVALADHLDTQSAKSWEHCRDAPGIAAVWLMMQRRRPTPEDVFGAVFDVVQRTAPVHLPLAHNVAHFFADESSDVPLLMTNDQKDRVKRALHDTLVSSFVGTGASQRLSLALRDGSPWHISWITWGLDRIRRGDRNGVPFDRWPEFSSVLLDLAEENPVIGVPLIVPFVTRGEMIHARPVAPNGSLKEQSGWVAQFEEERARQLFDFDKLVKILKLFEVPENLDAEIREHCHAAVKAARAFASGSDDGASAPDAS